MDPSTLDAVLAGNFELDTLPEVASKVIKVYLATTATDTQQERNALLERVYPKLRDYTRERYGLEFQVIDLRWGRQDDWPDHSNDRNLYWKYIRECQKLSVGPNFLAIFGQKYGRRPLPIVIQATDFETFKNALNNHRNRDTRDAALLDEWYKLDENAEPPEYILQSYLDIDRPKSSRLTITNHGVQKTEMLWCETEASLKRLIKKAVEYEEINGTNSSFNKTCVMSDFEREIQEGVMENPNPDSACLVLVRDVVDLTNYVSYPVCTDYMEIIYDMDQEKWLPNMDSIDQLKNVRAKLESCLPRKNRPTFSVLWRFDNEMQPKFEEQYINELCKTAESNLKSLIDRNASSVEQAENNPLPPIVTEVTSHWMVCRDLCRHFTGRDEALKQLQTYIVRGGGRPMVVHGVEGAGKSSLIAKVASEVHTFTDRNLITIVRFLGTTSASFDISQILHSICHQLTSALGLKEEKVPDSFKDLQNFFQNLLASIPNDKQVVLFLDGLDMLVPQYNAYYLKWLPKELAANVRIVLSTLPDQHDLLLRLRAEVVQDDRFLVEVDKMSREDCVALFQTLMEQESRALVQDHWEVVDKAFEKCALPLFVKLLAEDAKTWKSYQTVYPEFVPDNIQHYVNSLFDRLEKLHGKVLVSRTLAYITASTTGLSDCELEDLLSLDESVLNEVYPNEAPDMRRIPPLVLYRLKHSLSSLLSRKESEGLSVFFWCHRIFMNITRLRYLNKEAERKEIHSYLADYMLGVWHKKPKPYEVQPKRRGEQVFRGTADRFVPSMPLTFSYEGKTRYNRRAYEQVPRHLFLSGRLEELNKLVLFRYEALYNKAKALSVEHILADFILNPSTEAVLVERALRDAKPYIMKDIDNMAAELVGRLLSYYDTHVNIKNLIDDIDRIGYKHCALLPNFPYHQVPGSPLRHTLSSSLRPTKFALMGEEGRYLLSKQTDNISVQIHDLATGEHNVDVPTSMGDMYVTPSGEYLVIVDNASQNTIKVHSCQNGFFFGQLIPLNQIDVVPKEKYKLTGLAISDVHLCLLVTIDTSYLLIADVIGCQFIHIEKLERKGNLCQLTPDHRYVYTNSESTLLAYDLSTYELVGRLELDKVPRHISFTQDGDKAFLVCQADYRIHVLHLDEGSIEFTYKVSFQTQFQDDPIMKVKVSNEEEMLLAVSKGHIVVYSTGSEQVLCHFPRPSDVPKEFKLPKSQYMDIWFNDAEFSPDDKFVIAIIFRHVHIWHITNNRLVASLQAPIGVISDLLVPPSGGQVVTHSLNSPDIHVWSLGDAVSHVGMLDRLTAGIEEIVISQNDNMALVRCFDSDEVGVLDMSTGLLVDLLTHPYKVHSFSISQDGTYAFIAMKQAKPGLGNMIWNIQNRKVIHEYGDDWSYSVPMRTENSFFAIFQPKPGFKRPFAVTQFTFDGDVCLEKHYDCCIDFVISAPFITPDDRYLVILTAENYNEVYGKYINPTICTYPIKGDSATIYTSQDLQKYTPVRNILRVKPYATNSFSVVVLYTKEPMYREGKFSNNNFDYCLGFLIFDICSGVVCQIIDEFVSPKTNLDRLIFSDDVSLCLDAESHIYNMATGFFIKKLIKKDIQPRALLLQGKVVLYYEENFIYAVRISSGEVIGRIDLHCKVTSIAACKNQRIVVVGLEDGGISSYLIIDDQNDTQDNITATLTSRRQSTPSAGKSRALRVWDKVETYSIPTYSRPQSSMCKGSKDKILLEEVKPLRPATTGDLTSALTRRSECNSRACSLM